MEWSYFLQEKSETSERVIDLVKHLKASNNVKVNIIRCNNAGENISLQKECKQEGLGITFQFTALYTPQHNRSVERSFATSYGCIRAMLNSKNIQGKLRQSLWPAYSKHLQAFGKIGIAKKGNRITSKLNDKGVMCMIIGYATDNASGTYRLLNLSTMKVFESINVQWLDMNYDQ